jgi:hypothetical protein
LKTVPQSDLFKHPHETSAKAIDGFDVEIIFGCGIEKKIETGFEPVLRLPVTN